MVALVVLEDMAAKGLTKYAEVAGDQRWVNAWMYTV